MEYVSVVSEILTDADFEDKIQLKWGRVETSNFMTFLILGFEAIM